MKTDDVKTPDHTPSPSAGSPGTRKSRPVCQGSEPEFGALLKNLAGHAVEGSKPSSNGSGRLSATHGGGFARSSSNPSYPTPTSFAPKGAVPVSSKKPGNWRNRNSGVNSKHSISVGPVGAKVELSGGVEDLLRDEYVVNAPRIQFENRTVPALGGIPLLRKLGQGGMGAVYYGIHFGFAKEVALKVLPFHLAQRDPGAVQRFFREARVATEISSEHLVHVIDVAQENGISYLVMEYVSGRNAGQLAKEARLSGDVGVSERTSLEVCIAACEGLAAAHARNVIHRDIKPDNILVPMVAGQTRLNYSAAKVADLGLARSEEMQSMTGSNSCLGTPGYMAPEQIADAHKAGKPADVFGLGATLYALLCSTSPFSGESVMPIMHDTIWKPHQPITAWRADVSKATITVIDLCLAKDPEHRYEDAAALLRALRACLKGLTHPQDVQFLDINGPMVKREKVERPAAENFLATPQRAKTRAFTYVCAALLMLAFGGIYASYAFFGEHDEPSRKAPMLTMAELDEDGKRRDDSYVEKDRIKKQNLNLANQKYQALADSRRIAVMDEKLKHDSLRDAYDALVEKAESAANKSDWNLADTMLNSASNSVGRAASSRQKTADDLRLKVNSELGKARAAKEAADLRSAIAARIENEPLDEFGHCAYMDAGARNQINDLLLKLNNTQQPAADIQFKNLLRRLERSVELDAGIGGKLELVLVSPGTFVMGYRKWAEGTGAEYEHAVTITKPFYISKVPVTVAQFSRFANGTRYKTDAEKEESPFGLGANGLKGSAIDWIQELNWRQPGFSQQQNHPVVCVSFADCQNYCNWIGKLLNKSVQLPSEAEWEYAARGMSGAQWPWGNTWEGKRCNHADLSLKGAGVAIASQSQESFAPVDDGFTYTSPVGSFDNASWCDAKDLAGNVSQWCNDWYGKNTYLQSTAADPIGPDNGEMMQFPLIKYTAPCHVVRGGSFLDSPDMQRTSARKKLPANWRSIDLGFRILIQPQKAK